LGSDALVPAFAAGAAVATGAALALAGPVVALAPIGLVALVLLAARPRLLLLLYAAAIVLFEDDELGFLPQRGALYDGVPSVADLTFAALAAATLVWLVQQRRTIRSPEPFTLALALLALALVGGALVGVTSGADPVDIVNSLRAFAPLLVLPLLVVNLIDDERLLVRAAAVGAALAGLKGLEGVIAWRTGAGRPLEGTTITFYEPASNFLLLVFVVGVVAAFLLKVRVPLWVLLALPVAAAAFVFSYRRNFWIAGLLALGLLLVLSRLQGDRRMLLPIAALVAVAAAAAVTWRGPPELEGPVAERFTSLRPAQITSNPYDRYRLDEQKNVIAEIRGNPVLGIGLGVPWDVTQPLPVELEGGRLYTHTVALWYWLKLGLAGLVAYLWLVLATVVAALTVARRGRNGVVRATALGLAVATIGMVVAETTGSFTGVSDRYSVLVALAIGWVASARRIVREGAQPA
jgi:O-antigen ligase